MSERRLYVVLAADEQSDYPLRGEVVGVHATQEGALKHALRVRGRRWKLAWVTGQWTLLS